MVSSRASENQALQAKMLGIEVATLRDLAAKNALDSMLQKLNTVNNTLKQETGVNLHATQEKSQAADATPTSKRRNP